MKWEVRLSGTPGKHPVLVELQRNSERWQVRLNGQAIDADVAVIDAHTVSVILEGRSYEVRVAEPSEGALKLQCGLQEFTAEMADPRAGRGRRHSALELEGRQQVLAPMPGKIVRVLVKEGEKVEAGQGLIVVEAMKMQNEVRSPKAGVVERLLSKEGQAVSAGEILVWVA